MSKAKYPKLVGESLRRYSQFLRQLAANSDNVELCRVASLLAETVDLAMEKGEQLGPDDLMFSVTDLRTLDLDAREALLNQYALGFGRDDAPIVVMGTEHAYELDHEDELVNFCLESCCGAVMWACGGSGELVRRLSGGDVDIERPFHIHPNDYFQERGAHTWVRLARVVGRGGEERIGAEPGLGDLCYQIDLSAHPKQRNSDSVPPTQERLEFLVQAMHALRGTSRVLLFHGKANDNGPWAAARDLLARAFTALPASEPFRWVDLSEPNRPLQYADVGACRIIVTRALANAGVTLEFLEQLAALVRFDDSLTSALQRRHNKGERATPPTPLDVVRLPARPDGRSQVSGDDVVAELERHALAVSREKVGWRGADGVDGRYVYWPRRKGAIPYLHLGNYRAETPITFAIQNGDVKCMLEFRGVERADALGALHEAIRLLRAQA